MTVLSEVERGEMVVVCEHFCLSVSLLSGKKSSMKNDKSITGRERGDGAFFIKIIAFVKSEPFHYRHQLNKERSKETTQCNNIYRGDQSWVK